MRSTIAALMLLGTVVGAHASAQNAAGSSPGAQLLRQYAGSYDTDGLLRHPRVRPQLQALLGTELPHLDRNLAVRGSVDVIGGELSIDGNAEHAGTEEEAVVCVSGDGPTVMAAILSGITITVYARATSYDEVSRCIKDWITQANSRHRDRLAQPGNVRLAAR